MLYLACLKIFIPRRKDFDSGPGTRATEIRVSRRYKLYSTNDTKRGSNGMKMLIVPCGYVLSPVLYMWWAWQFLFGGGKDTGLISKLTPACREENMA